jgi:Flp pilus assembly protein TadG
MSKRKTTPYKPSFKQRGQSLVEMALSMMIIMMLLAGAVDFGIAYFDYVALRDAAQEGAVYGSVCPGNTANIIQRIKQSSTAPINFALDGNFQPPQIIVTGAGGTGDTITVNLQYNYQLSMPLIGGIIGTQVIPLRASVTNTILLGDDPTCGH